MPTDDLTAWLGPAADEMTADQRSRFDAEAERITARYPDPDHQPEREAALSAAVQYLLGETKAIDVANALTAARMAEARALAAAQQVATMLVADKVASEVVAARDCGIDRMTLRKALGKR